MNFVAVVGLWAKSTCKYFSGMSSKLCQISIQGFTEYFVKDP